LNRKLFYIIVGLILSLQSFSQTDTEFWFAAPAVTSGHENTPIVFRLTTYDQPAVITISEPANASFVPIVINLNANSTVTRDVTAFINSIESKPSGTPLNYGIKITSTSNISAYYEVGRLYNPEIFPLKGNTAKGLSFIIPSQTQYDNRAGINPNANNGFVIVATEDNTSIDITLTKPDGNGRPAGTFNIILNKGQTYAVIGSSTLASLHLGGSEITSNKPICVTIFDDSIYVGSSLDIAGDQIVPISNTGTEFIIVRGALTTFINGSADLYYVWATADGTNIYLNGSATPIATINKGQSYKGVLNSNSVYITTSNPSYVLQFTGVGTEVTQTSLPSIKCTGSNSVSFVRSTNELFYLNLICKSDDVNNFKLNGNAGVISSSLFFDVPGATGWKAARISTANLTTLNTLVPDGVATVVSNSTGLFHLGFLNGGSSSGARLGYFSNYSKISMAPNLITSACMGSDIQLAANQLNGVVYQWTGPNGFSSNVYNPIIPTARVQDSGYYYLTATLTGCGSSLDSINIKVNPLPTIQFTKSLDTVCIGNSRAIQYQLTGKAPWNLSYTNGAVNTTINNLLNSNNSFTVSPTTTTIYRVTNLIDSNNCSINLILNPTSLYDTIKVNRLPVPNFNFSAIRCEKNDIVFTDQSTADLDAVANWYWNMGNGNILNLSNGNPFTQVFPNWGKDTVKLALRSSFGCVSDTLTKVIEINPLPIVGFKLPFFCLNDGQAVFKDSTTSKGTPTPFSYQWNFNAGTTPISPGPSFAPGQLTQANPSVIYNKEGNYFVQLKVTSSQGCVDSLTRPFVINGSYPISNFKVLKDTALCSYEEVLIKDSSWVYPGSIGSMRIVWGDGTDTTIVDSKIGNIYKHKYANAVASNNYNYNINMQVYSGGTCFDDSLRAIQIVRPPTSVSLQSNQNYLCIYDSMLIKKRVVGGTPPFKYNYTLSNSNATLKDSTLFGATSGNVNVNLKVTDIKNCNYQYDNLVSINLPVLPIANILAKDTVICNGDAVTLKGSGGNVFKWFNNGSLLNTSLIDSLIIGNVGNYALVVNDGKCFSLPSTPVNIMAVNVPMVNFSYYPISCTNGDLKILTNAMDLNNIHYVWNFGDSNYFYRANPIAHNYNKVGRYVMRLTVSSDYCPKYNYTLMGDTIQIKDPIPPSKFTLFVLANQDTMLMPKKVDSGYVQYQWIPSFNLNNPYIPNPIFRGPNDIDYTLLRIDTTTGCKILDEYHLDVSEEVVVTVPNAFTPNGDNLNDLFKIEYGAGVKTLLTYTIFNRFGKVVFQTNDLSKGWDGKNNGFDQEMDAYTYLIEYITYKDLKVRKTGSFILLR
jgi:gliding motility-associated-like protein